MSSNIPWDTIPDATEDNKRAADMLIRMDDGQERRTKYDGGWMYLADSVHTSDNKQAVTADTLTHVTIDGLADGSTTDFRRGVPLDVFGNSTMQPLATGETYEINLTFRASKATSTDTFVEVDVGIGSDYSTIIARDRRALTKGSGIEDFVFFNGTLFATEPFTRYGARFFLNASENVSIWDKAIFLQRTHSP
jgi:hypothetical protein